MSPSYFIQWAMFSWCPLSLLPRGSLISEGRTSWGPPIYSLCFYIMSGCGSLHPSVCCEYIVPFTIFAHTVFIYIFSSLIQDIRTIAFPSSITPSPSPNSLLPLIQFSTCLLRKEQSSQ